MSLYQNNYQKAVYPPVFGQPIHQLRPRAVSCPTRMQPLQASPPPDTNTVHIAYRPGVTDRGELYLHFRTYPGFELFAFYDHYCFARFIDRESARRALFRPVPQGVITLEPAQKNYRVPYPQPDEDSAPCKVIHVTHLPTNYSKEEMCKVFQAFPGFLKIQFHGKYGYVFYETELSAAKCWKRLRFETNLVVSYAKNAKLDEEDLLSIELERLALKARANSLHSLQQLRTRLPAPAIAQPYLIDERYTLLNRESIKQLDADIKNDFEQLLLESQCRLCPQPFDNAPHIAVSKPPSSPSFEEDEKTFVNDSSFDEEKSFFSENGSPSAGAITPGTRTLVSSPTSGQSPGTNRNASEDLLKASALLRGNATAPNAERRLGMNRLEPAEMKRMGSFDTATRRASVPFAFPDYGGDPHPQFSPPHGISSAWIPAEIVAMHQHRRASMTAVEGYIHGHDRPLIPLTPYHAPNGFIPAFHHARRAAYPEIA